MTRDYKRNGTTTLFAALNVLDGQVIGQCQQQPASAFVVPEPQLLFELLVVALDAPAYLGLQHHALKRHFLRQGAQSLRVF